LAVKKRQEDIDSFLLKRLPRHYDGIQPTGKSIQQLLPHIMRKVSSDYKEQPTLILAAWSKVLGEKLAPMTEAVSFEKGVLVVKVKNSSLYSLLSQHEKSRLLKSLKEMFPSVTIRNIIFRIG